MRACSLWLFLNKTKSILPSHSFLSKADYNFYSHTISLFLALFLSLFAFSLSPNRYHVEWANNGCTSGLSVCVSLSLSLSPSIPPIPPIPPSLTTSLLAHLLTSSPLPTLPRSLTLSPSLSFFLTHRHTHTPPHVDARAARLLTHRIRRAAGSG